MLLISIFLTNGISGLVVCTRLPWPMSSRSSSHAFSIKTWHVFNIWCTFATAMNWLFPYLAHITTSMRGGVVCNELCYWPICVRPISHDFLMKLLKFGLHCHVCLTVPSVLNGFFFHLVQMMPIFWGCVMCNDFLTLSYIIKVFTWQQILLWYCTASQLCTEIYAV